tara:strand:- start:83 stop:298 length:216 start_codon:yes stop_codon:yes gene_type:complete
MTRGAPVLITCCSPPSPRACSSRCTGWAAAHASAGVIEEATDAAAAAAAATGRGGGISPVARWRGSGMRTA